MFLNLEKIMCMCVHIYGTYLEVDIRECDGSYI